MPRPIEALIHTDALAHNLARARAPRPTRGSGRWSRPTPTATASSASFDGLRGADGFALLDLDEAERVRALGWRGPILLLEGVLRARATWSCVRA